MNLKENKRRIVSESCTLRYETSASKTRFSCYLITDVSEWLYSPYTLSSLHSLFFFSNCMDIIMFQLEATYACKSLNELTICFKNFP